MRAAVAGSLRAADVADRHALRRKIRVYTRTGDKGTTSLFTGERRTKDDAFFAALGDTDELNAHIGLAREHCRQEATGIDHMLEHIQSRLLDAGTAIATPASGASERKRQVASFDAGEVEQLERWIDELDDTLPPLRAFILPVRPALRRGRRRRRASCRLTIAARYGTAPQSGGFASAQLHVARTVCRRAERSVVPLTAAEEVDAVVQRYLNRCVLLARVRARVVCLTSCRTQAE